MKTLRKFKYVLFFLFGLLAVSCSDDVINPRGQAGGGGDDDDDDDPIIIGGSVAPGGGDAFPIDSLINR